MHVTEEKTKPLRRSKRFTPEQNARLDKLEIIEEEEEGVAPIEQPNFGLGLKKRMITRANNSQAIQQ